MTSWPRHSSVVAAPLAATVWQHIEFKVTLLVYKSLHGMAPSYLLDDC